jgi:hypothetical protein
MKESLIRAYSVVARTKTRFQVSDLFRRPAVGRTSFGAIAGLRRVAMVGRPGLVPGLTFDIDDR